MKSRFAICGGPHIGSFSCEGGRRRATALAVLSLLVFPTPLFAAAADRASVAPGAVVMDDLARLDAKGGTGLASLSPDGVGGDAARTLPRGTGQVSIDVGTANGLPGSRVRFAATLDTGGQSVIATGNEIAFDLLTPIAATSSGRPDCTLAAGIDKTFAAVFEPHFCTPGVDCTGVLILVVALSNLDPIPDGPLYECNVEIDAAAPSGSYPLVISDTESADPAGLLLVTGGTDGAVLVDPTMDVFKCYKVRDLREPRFTNRTVSLSDQFVDEDAEVRRPFLLCGPTGTNGAGIADPSASLVCYKIKAPRLASRPHVEVHNRFGTGWLRVGRPTVLCVPSTNEVLP